MLNLGNGDVIYLKLKNKCIMYEILCYYWLNMIYYVLSVNVLVSY